MKPEIELWTYVQERLKEPECFTEDQFNIWLHHYGYERELILGKQKCEERLNQFHSTYPKIQILYIDSGNCIGAAFYTAQVIIINPLQLLFSPELVCKYIIPHEYLHIVLDEDGHTDKFYEEFKQLIKEPHPPLDIFPDRNKCISYLEVKSTYKGVFKYDYV